ncbi:MAG: G5 domain-containing protein [Candidatus Moranbacteria bacterium]|nr:G5 domain-containing protein [Candidatus Moranbacteria bacterium]
MKKIFFVIVVVVSGVGVYIFTNRPDDNRFLSAAKNICLVDEGMTFSLRHHTGQTVSDFLEQEKIFLGPKDIVFPEKESKVFFNTCVYIDRAQKIIVVVDKKEQEIFVQAPTIEGALVEGGVVLDEDDIVKPGRGEGIISDMIIRITRVEIEEQSVEKAVSFEKKTVEDDKLSWRKTSVTQKGEKGIDRLTYRVSKHDGKEVNRKLIKTERIKEPVTEITTQGTYVKLGKSHRGAASWYAWTGTMAAANPWLPKGSYVKVTNMANGKSVIVVINDRGPFVPGRIIDLDKVAFAQIASVGAGVIDVKMEEITN